MILGAAPTTKRFPSPRCASAIQIVRPSQSMAETQPKLQPALLRLSAMIASPSRGVDSRLLFFAQFLESRIGAQNKASSDPARFTAHGAV